VLRAFVSALEAGLDPEEIASVVACCGATANAYQSLLADACASSGLPLPLTERDIDLSDHSTAIIDEGRGEPPIVIVHSLGLDWRMAHFIVQPLAVRGRVIAYDLRLHGRATTVPTPSFRLSRCADDLADLLDALAIQQAHIVGFSLGGAVAQLFALAHAPRVASLALVCTMARAPRGVYIERARSAKEGGMESQVSPTLSRWFNIGELAKNTLAVRYARAKVLGVRVEHWVQYWHALAQVNTVARLGELGNHPTSVIAAELDKSTPPATMRRIADRIPDAHFVTIPAAPHMTSLECPTGTTKALIEHLDRVQLHANP
jgi:3-oxoadipate enol-lactonase